MRYTSTTEVFEHFGASESRVSLVNYKTDTLG